jgi:hypothetical protein
MLGVLVSQLYSREARAQREEVNTLRILAIVLVSAFILSVTPVVVLAGGGGCSYEQAYQPQLVKTQPQQTTPPDKSAGVLVAQEESAQKTPPKVEKR